MTIRKKQPQTAQQEAQKITVYVTNESFETFFQATKELHLTTHVAQQTHAARYMNVYYTNPSDLYYLGRIFEIKEYERQWDYLF